MRVGIVGATGAVGEELLAVMEQRGFPVGELVPTASERSVGRAVRFAGREWPVLPLEGARLDECDLVFLSAGASISRALAPKLLAGRPRLYDNTSAFRLDPKVALVVPEVNGHRLTPAIRHAAVANCTAILLVLALAPLERAFGLDRVVVSTYQAVSGGGRRALERLKDELRRELAGEVLPAGASPPFAFNCIPSIGEIDPGDDVAARTTGEEKKVGDEVRRILERPDLSIVATCVRVPVLRAHSESVLVELRDREARLDDVIAALRDAAGIELRDDLARGVLPMPRLAAGGDLVQVGRIRPADRPGCFTFFLAGDQLRKGAALTAVQLAELQFGTG
ncbi:MAG: aspartate-semialdehyde dehydrogenase [Planctomycetes bacterium]|nr:aspartate-semialdehyde dehydrogenase [Planctomycetota bacterium]